jgi:hypothetical protein
VVDVTDQHGTIFDIFSTKPPLMLSASRECRDILLQAFFRKANVSIEYQPTTLNGLATPCNPADICGKVTRVVIQSPDF